MPTPGDIPAHKPPTSQPGPGAASACTERHPFEPFLPEGARVLFLGSFPPQPHRWCMPFYYPNWINDFWRILGLIHFGDKDHFCIPGEKRFDEAAIRAFCTAEGLAFYDTACEVRRLKDNASDAFLEVVTPTDIPALLSRIPQCHTLVTPGEKASTLAATAFSSPIPPVGTYIDIPLALSPGSAIGISPCGSTIISPCDPVSSTSANPTFSPSSSPITSPSTATALSPAAEGSLRFWRMPSTSRAYPLPLEKKAAAYSRLFETLS